MQSNAKANSDLQLQHKIRRIIEGVLMLGGAIVGIWLLAAVATFILK